MNSTLVRFAPWLSDGKSVHFSPDDVGVVSFATAGDGKLEPCGIGPESIVAGMPRARASTEAKSPDGCFATGMWDCTAGVLDIQFGCDELVHILEGEVTVRSMGRTHRLTPGSVAYFPRGVVALWEIPVYVKKVYVHRYMARPSLLKRAVRKLGRMAGLWD